MDSIARAFYAVFGALGIAGGAAILFVPTLLADPADPPVIQHLMREQAAGFVFIGLMCFWAFRNPAARKPVHVALLVFTGLFAVIHWADYFGDYRRLLSPIANSIPSLILLITWPRRRAAAA